MNIAILGYGKMGRLIKELAEEQGHTVKLIIDSDNTQDLNKSNLNNCDVAIEFSTPASALNNIKTCLQSQTPIVVGTTGQWYQQLHLIEQIVKENSTALLYATNFSIGVNIFFAINNYLASIMSSHKEYNPSIEEIHHTQKLDSPSGTAITIAEDAIARLNYKTKWKNISNCDDSHLDNTILPITSIRKDPAPGTHIVKYTSLIDSIEIRHEAFNRTGFALGAITAAQWLIGKKGIFTMKDILKFT